MLDHKILDLARSLVHPQLAERQDALLRELRAIQRKAAAEGWYNGGRFVVTATQLSDAEIKIRLRLVSGQLFRVVTEAGVPPDPELEQNLKHELSIHANEAKQSVTETIISHLRHFDSRVVDEAKARLSEAETRGIALVAGEIGLFAHKHNQPRAGTAAAQTVVHVVGPRRSNADWQRGYCECCSELRPGREAGGSKCIGRTSGLPRYSQGGYGGTGRRGDRGRSRSGKRQTKSSATEITIDWRWCHRSNYCGCATGLRSDKGCLTGARNYLETVDHHPWRPEEIFPRTKVRS